VPKLFILHVIMARYGY